MGLETNYWARQKPFWVEKLRQWNRLADDWWRDPQTLKRWHSLKPASLRYSGTLLIDVSNSWVTTTSNRGDSPLSNQLPNLKKPCDTIRTSHQNTTVLDVGNSGPASVARHSMESVSWLRRSTVHPRWRIGWRVQPTCLSCSCWSTDVFKQKWTNKLPFNATSKKIQGYIPSKRGRAPKYVEARSHVQHTHQEFWVWQSNCCNYLQTPLMFVIIYKRNPLRLSCPFCFAPKEISLSEV